MKHTNKKGPLAATRNPNLYLKTNYQITPKRRKWSTIKEAMLQMFGVSLVLFWPFVIEDVVRAVWGWLS